MITDLGEFLLSARHLPGASPDAVDFAIVPFLGVEGFDRYVG
jgi:hypothetical protein